MTRAGPEKSGLGGHRWRQETTFPFSTSMFYELKIQFRELTHFMGTKSEHNVGNFRLLNKVESLNRFYKISENFCI